MQDMMDLKSDMTTNMTGPITAPASFQSEGPSGVTNPPVMNTIGPQLQVWGHIPLTQ